MKAPFTRGGIAIAEKRGYISADLSGETQWYHYLCGFFEKEAQATKEVKRSSTGVPERACL